MITGADVFNTLRLKVSGKDKQIIKRYLRYALLKCSQYAKSTQYSEELAIYTLTTVCVLTENSECSEPPAELIDRLIKVIYPDIVKPLGVESEPLFSNEKMQKLVSAMNNLDNLSQQVLVLNHIEMMNTKEISQIYNKSIPQIRETIINGEKELAKSIAQLCQDDVCLWLDELADALGLGRQMRIIEAIENYLAEPKKARRMVQKYLDAI